MAGDRRATAGNIIVTDRVDKVIEIDATSLLAIAGVPATAFEMARVLQTSFEYYRRSQLQSLSLPAKVRALARLLRENLPMTMQGIGVVAPLFAGWTIPFRRRSRRFIFMIRSARNSRRWITSLRFGLGHDPQHSQLSGTIRQPAALTDESRPSREIRLRLLMVASEFDSATGGVNPATETYATIRVLRSTGVEAVTDEQQSNF